MRCVSYMLGWGFIMGCVIAPRPIREVYNCYFSSVQLLYYLLRAFIDSSAVLGRQAMGTVHRISLKFVAQLWGKLRQDTINTAPSVRS